MAKQSIPQEQKSNIFSKLREANLAFQALYPGDLPNRQPVHTVYGGANLFKSDTAQKMGATALASMEEYAPDFVTFAKAMNLPTSEFLDAGTGDLTEHWFSGKTEAEQKRHESWLCWRVYHRVKEKLQREPVEDFRIDFEDGFGNRPDEEEDKVAVQAATEVAKGMTNGTLPPFIGIRIKPFTEDMKERGARTLDIFLTTLSELTNGKLPENFVVMLPKVTIPDQVSALVRLFEIIEENTSISDGALKLELMVETTQSIMDAEGKNPLRKFIDAGEGRCIATAFGTYDYTASNNITAKYQDMDHPVCEFAHHVTKVALGHTGVFLADGATNVIPVGPHRGENLSEEQIRENNEVVHHGWKLSYDHIRNSLYNGFYQGWDLNPAQLPSRYAAVYTFFLESYEGAANRLRNFMEASARVTLSGDIFDDAATGQGLLNYFLRGLNCGAITEEEALATGLSLEEFQMRSFYKILLARKNKGVEK